MLHDKIFISVELTPNGCVTLLVVQAVFHKKSMAPQLRRIGVRAKTSCLSKFMHPSEHIRNKFPNPVGGHHLEGCVVVQQEVKCVTKRDRLCVVVWHDDFKADNEHIELHAVKQYFRVMEVCDPELFFDDPGTVGGEEDAAPIPLPEAVDDAINGASEEVNTIEALQGVVDIDDNNEPAPENVPATTDTSNRLLSTEWGHDGFCFQKSQNFGSTRARLNFSVDPTCHGYYVSFFEGFFPKELLQNVIDIVNEKMNGEEEVVYGQFLQWIGIWVLMSTVDGVDRHSFWSNKNDDAFDGAPFHLTLFMSCRCFEKILYNIGYMKEDPPQYCDHFWEV